MNSRTGTTSGHIGATINKDERPILKSNNAPKESASPRGAFIVIEGLDRAGKTTQVKKLNDALYERGQNVRQLRFPDRSTTIGQMIDKYLRSETEIEDHVIHLLFSTNRWELASSIEASLAEGTTVIVDRYYYSGMIYSAAKGNRSLPLDWARDPEVGLPRPDLVIFLDLAPEQAEARGGFGEEKYEKREMQERVRTLFLGLKDRKDEEAEDMVIVNAGASIEDVHKDILARATQKVVLVQQKGLGTTVRRVGRWSSAKDPL